MKICGKRLQLVPYLLLVKPTHNHYHSQPKHIYTQTHRWNGYRCLPSNLSPQSVASCQSSNQTIRLGDATCRKGRQSFFILGLRRQRFIRDLSKSVYPSGRSSDNLFCVHHPLCLSVLGGSERPGLLDGVRWFKEERNVEGV